MLRGARQGVEHFAPQFGREAVGKSAFKRKRHQRVQVKQPGAGPGTRVGNGGNDALIDRIVHRLDRESVRTAASVGVNRGFSWACMARRNLSPKRECIMVCPK